MYTRNVLNLDNMDKKKSMYDFISINKDTFKKMKLIEREKVVVHHKLPTLVLCCIAVVVGSYSFEMSTQRSN